MATSLAAYLFTTAVGLVVVFQLALALGAPWGEYAMGGRWPGTFPLRLRVAALVQALLLSGLALVVLSRAGVVMQPLPGASGSLIWVVVGISLLSLVMNLATPSRWERILWAPVASVMAATSLFVALR